MDTFIATRTYILRNTLSIADIALWAAIKRILAFPFLLSSDRCRDSREVPLRCSLVQLHLRGSFREADGRPRGRHAAHGGEAGDGSEEGSGDEEGRDQSGRNAGIDAGASLRRGGQGGDALPSRSVRIHARWPREGCDAELLLREALSRQASASLRRHQPEQREGRVRNVDHRRSGEAGNQGRSVLSM